VCELCCAVQYYSAVKLTVKKEKRQTENATVHAIQHRKAGSISHSDGPPHLQTTPPFKETIEKRDTFFLITATKIKPNVKMTVSLRERNGGKKHFLLLFSLLF
jgi:hypothetical protein